MRDRNKTWIRKCQASIFLQLTGQDMQEQTVTEGKETLRNAFLKKNLRGPKQSQTRTSRNAAFFFLQPWCSTSKLVASTSCTWELSSLIRNAKNAALRASTSSAPLLGVWFWALRSPFSFECRVPALGAATRRYPAFRASKDQLPAETGCCRLIWLPGLLG